MNRKSVCSAALCLVLIGASATVNAGIPGQSDVAKGYIIAEINVTNTEAYAEYVAQVPTILAACGGRYIVRAGNSVVREGPPLQGRLIVIEFPSFAAAQDCLDATPYRSIEHLRTDNAVSRIIVVEGLSS